MVLLKEYAFQKFGVIHKKSPTHRAFPGVDRSLPPLLVTFYHARQAFSPSSTRCSQTVGGRLIWLECKSKRNAAGLSATIAFTPSDCRRFPAGPVAFSRTGRARNAPKHGIRASAGHAHASPAQSFAGLSATPVRFSLPGRFFRLFSPVNYLLPPSRDGFRTTSSGLIRTIPSSPSRSLGRSLEAACRGVFPPRLLLG